MVLATKFAKPMADNPADRRGTRTYILSAVEASLRRLRTDWIDLLYMHEPDPGTPIEETLRAAEELRTAGKVRALAASNFSPGEIGDAVEAAKRLGVAGFVATQDEYSLLDRGIEDALLPVLETHRLSLVPYFPLAGGALSGKYRKGQPMPEGARLTNAPSGAERFLGGGTARQGRGAHRLRRIARTHAPRAGAVAGSRRGRRSPRSSPARRSPSRSRPTSRPSAGR